MKKQLLYTFSLLFLLSGSISIAFAQTGKSNGGSRLEIGRKKAPTKPVLSWQQGKVLTHFPLSNKFFVSEIRYRKPDAINQYFKTSLLQNNRIVVKAAPLPVELVAEKSNEIQVGDKLFSNEKLIVSNVYPNPASDYVMVDYNITGNLNEAKLTFYSLLGSQIAEYDLDKFDKNIRVSTSNLASGIYLYQLSVDGQKLMTKKFLVRHQ